MMTIDRERQCRNLSIFMLVVCLLLSIEIYLQIPYCESIWDLYPMAMSLFPLIGLCLIFNFKQGRARDNFKRFITCPSRRTTKILTVGTLVLLWYCICNSMLYTLTNASRNDYYTMTAIIGILTGNMIAMGVTEENAL